MGLSPYPVAERGVKKKEQTIVAIVFIRLTLFCEYNVIMDKEYREESSKQRGVRRGLTERGYLVHSHNLFYFL